MWPRLTNIACTWAACLLLTLPAAAVAQRLSFGLLGGTNITCDFDRYGEYFRGDPNDARLSLSSVCSGTHSLILGPTFEIRVSRGFSVEIDALHRNLVLNGRITPPNGATQLVFKDSVSTWEWPVPLKYRVQLGRMSPFIEAGPYFRTRKSPGSTEPSQRGGTLGVGAELHVGHVRLSPTVRYTRWQYDGPYPRRASKRDQLELLTGVSYDMLPERWNLGGRKLRVGVIGGAPFTRGFLENNVDEEQGYAVGLQVEYEYRERLSLGFSGLYRPLRGFSVSTFQGSTFRNEFTVLTWEFPVLATYALRNSPVWRPFIEGGPSFPRHRV